jgi:ribosomal protein S14
MAGRLLISKQYFKRERFENKINYHRIKKMLSNDMFLPFNFYYNLNIKGKNYSNSTYYTRCRISGRAKANFNKFKMSRMIFKRYGEQGYLNGIKKANW